MHYRTTTVENHHKVLDGQAPSLHGMQAQQNTHAAMERGRGNGTEPGRRKDRAKYRVPGEEARAIIDESRAMLKASGRSRYVFPSLHSLKRHFNIHSFEAFWYKFRKKAGFPDVRMHDLRQSFASESVRQGIPLSVVSKLLGHFRIKMTMSYVHVSNRDDEEAAERIGKSLITQLHYFDGECSMENLIQ